MYNLIAVPMASFADLHQFSRDGVMMFGFKGILIYCYQEMQAKVQKKIQDRAAICV
jgi:hypothetical protein